MLAGMGLIRAAGDSAFAPALIFFFSCAVGFSLSAVQARIPWKLFSAFIVCLVCGVGVAYLGVPVLFEDAETNIACVSAVAMRGAPIYPAMDAAVRYSLAYGPLTYLAHVPFYWAFGQSLVSFKLPGVLALLFTLGAAYRICRRFATTRHSLVGVGGLSLVFFRYLHVEFWGRNDPMLLAFTALALWAVVEAGDLAAIALVGLSFAALPNLKITAVFYVLPILVLLIVRRGWKLSALAIAVSLALFPAPFLLSQVSVAGYGAVLQAVGRHGLSGAFLVRNLQYAAVFLLPVAALIWFGPRHASISKPQVLYFSAIVIGLLGACISGAKIGAGSYHLLPLTLPILVLYFWVRSDRDPAPCDRAFSKFAIVWVFTMLLYSVNFVEAVWHAYGFARTARPVLAEIRSAEARYGSSALQVGIGDDFRDARTFYSYAPVFSGAPYLTSGASVRDIQFGGVPLSVATVADVRNCVTAVWLIPRGQQPFSAQNTYYSTAHPAFDRAFRDAFASTYRRSSSGPFYDVWTCQQ